jgi:hypothetical protein
MAELEKWVADNYEGLVADPATHWTFENVAEFADANDSASLAAWARSKAAEAGEDVTPVEPAETKVTRTAETVVEK